MKRSVYCAGCLLNLLFHVIHMFQHGKGLIIQQNFCCPWPFYLFFANTLLSFHTECKSTLYKKIYWYFTFLFLLNDCSFKKRKLFIIFCQPQAKAKAKAMPGRLYIHTK